MFKHLRIDNMKLAFKVTWQYAIFGVLWIGFSDRILGVLVTDMELYGRIQTVKGWLFILVTSILLYLLVQDVVTKASVRNTELAGAYEEYKENFNNANAGILIMDQDHNIEKVNDTFLEMVGLSFDEIKALLYSDLIRYEEMETERVFINRLMAGEINHFIIDKRVVINEKKMWIREGVKRLGETERLISVLLEISDLKEIEEKSKVDLELIERHREEDRRLIERLRKEMDVCQSRLVVSERMASLGGLIAGFTHEINTPIGVSLTTNSFLIKQYTAAKVAFDAQTLSKGELENFFSELDEALELMNKNLLRAADYIGSFKQNAVDQSNFNKREFNMKLVLDDCIASIKPLTKKKDYKINVSCPEDITINTYPGAISHTVSNLILNAVNHGFDGRDHGTITVEVEVVKDMIKLVVLDDGKGIPEYAIQRIYRPFFTTKPDEGGTGLGLSLVYDMVTENLGGKVVCESIEGKGTRFTIEFPYVKVEA